MKIVRCAFLAVLLAPMFGCGLLASSAGVEEYTDKDGVKRVRVVDTPLADQVTGLLGLLGPWGIAAGAGLSLAKRVIRHREVLAHGQKDDDFDGIPDDQQTPPSPPTAS